MRGALEPRDARFANPYWHALKTEQAAIAVGGSGTGDEISQHATALRFPADVIPFAGVARADVEALSAVRDLLAPGEAVYLTADELQPCDGLVLEVQLPGLQMLFLGPAPTGDAHDVAVVELDGAHADEMVHLTDVAFPGFFRQRTYTLGRYFGIRIDGELVAMAGERLALPGWREVSAVCTHPSHRGKGHAAALIRHLLRVHEASGLRSFLHLAQANVGALALYERLGFTSTRELLFHRIRRGIAPGDRLNPVR